MRRHLMLATSLLALTTAAAAQESVLLRVGGQVGQTNRYQTVANTWIQGGPMAGMGDTSQPMMRLTTITTRTLTAVEGDTLVFTETVDDARSESPAMPQMGAMMGNAANMMRGQVTTTKMDGRARMFSIESSNPNMQGGQGGGPGGRGMMGGMRNQRARYVLPERPIRIGETWSDSTIIPGNGTDGPSSLLASFKLDRVDTRGGTRIAVITVDGNMATSSARGPQRMSVTGQFQLDMTAGRLASLDMTMSGTSNMQGQEVPVRMQLTQQLVP